MNAACNRQNRAQKRVLSLLLYFATLMLTNRGVCMCRSRAIKLPFHKIFTRIISRSVLSILKRAYARSRGASRGILNINRISFARIIFQSSHFYFREGNKNFSLLDNIRIEYSIHVFLIRVLRVEY